MSEIVCDNNRQPCTCTYPGCPRHGKCCECVVYHNRSGDFPGCFFSKAGEASFDRSLSMLVRSRKRTRE